MMLPRDSIFVLQLSDTHLFADPGQTLKGMNTSQSLQAVLKHAQQQQWPPDLMLVTGDLIHDDSATGYSNLKRAFAEFPFPVYMLPGNHDIPHLMQEILPADNIILHNYLVIDDWQILMLDTCIAGKEEGWLATRELDRMRETLDAHPQLHTLIAMHHPPLAHESEWLDTMQVGNSAEFLQLVEAYPNVRLVIWGHVHQEFERKLGGVSFLGTPSTCIQFQPRARSFTIDSQRLPGYRWLRLHANGEFETGIERIRTTPDVQL